MFWSNRTRAQCFSSRSHSDCNCFSHVLTAVRKNVFIPLFCLNPTVSLLFTAFLALMPSSLPNYFLLMLSKVTAVMASPNFSKILWNGWKRFPQRNPTSYSFHPRRFQRYIFCRISNAVFFLSFQFFFWLCQAVWFQWCGIIVFYFCFNWCFLKILMVWATEGLTVYSFNKFNYLFT